MKNLTIYKNNSKSSKFKNNKQFKNSRILKILSLIISLSLIQSNSILNVQAKTLPTSFKISKASEPIVSYDWSMGDQGYRLYLVDKNNKIVSNKLDIIYGNPSIYENNLTLLSNSTKLSFDFIEKYLDEPTYSIPFALGFKVSSNGQKSLQGYTKDNKSLIMDWLLGGDEKPYYIVSNADIDEDGKTDGDFKTISEAIQSVPESSTILVQSTDKPYIDIVNVTNPVSLIGLTKNGTKPILENSNGDNIEMCHYAYCPLMIASGFVKDIDIIEMESQQSFYETECSLSEEYNRKITKEIDGNIVEINAHSPINIAEEGVIGSPTTYAVHVENYYSMDKYLEFDNCTLISRGNNTLGMGTRKGLKFNMKNCSLIATPESTGTPMFIHDSVEALPGLNPGELITDALGKYSCTFENCVFESKKSDNIDITLRNYTEVTRDGTTIKTNNKGTYNFINCKLVEPRDTRMFNIKLEGHTFNYDEGNTTIEVNNVQWVKYLNFETDENYASWGLLNIKGLTLINGDTSHETFSDKYLSNNTFGLLGNIDKVSNKTLNPIDSEQGYERLNKLLNIKVNNRYFFENISSGAKTGSDNNGDGEPDNVTDMMEINNYSLVVEPIIWIQPANYINGSYRNVSKNIVYGTFKEIAVYLSENSNLHVNDKSSNVYSVLNALSKITS